VRVRASSVNRDDLEYLGGRPYAMRLLTGVRTPKNRGLGLDVAGEVKAVGEQVATLRPGDTVFGDLTQFGFGAFSEYVSAPERAFAPMPIGMSFEQAATVPHSATLALQGLHYKRPIEPGESVLINGASGGVGTFAVQIAKALGAEVTGTCRTTKQELVHALGADHVIDYTQMNFTHSGQCYDRILDVQAHYSILAYRRSLNPSGVYACVGGATGAILQALVLGPLLSSSGNRQLGVVGHDPFKPEDMVFLQELISADTLVPVIDKSYPLSEVAEALRYVDAGHARGKVVISM
jgi:NADPH:quinone reductase-like Zn-dependent oxidoreductase